LSLFDIGDGGATIYVRYSKLHAGGRRTFYGLRRDDLRRLEGRNSYVVFLWDGQREPLFVRYAEYEPVFSELAPASDGQFKAQVYLDRDGTDLYIANAGRYNVEGGFGWDVIEQATKLMPADKIPLLSHQQVQTLLGSIGARKGYDVWIPPNDRLQLDWGLTPKFHLQKNIAGFDTILSGDRRSRRNLGRKGLKQTPSIIRGRAFNSYLLWPAAVQRCTFGGIGHGNEVFDCGRRIETCALLKTA
jgi:hypothetical protein